MQGGRQRSFVMWEDGVRRFTGVLLAGMMALGAFVASGSSVGAVPAVGPSPVSGWTSFAAGVKANAIVFDATRNKVLAALPGTVPALGNDVVELDPATGALGRSVFVGANPSALAVSSDGTTLYVGLGGANRIDRINLATFKVVSSFSTGADSFEGPKYAAHLAIAPNDDDVVVASLHSCCFEPPFAGFVAYDNGVARAKQGTAEGTEIESFAFGSNASTIYGYDSDDSGFGLYTWSLSSAGLTQVHSAGNLVSGFFTTIKFAGGRIYGSTGAIVDPTTDSLLGGIPGEGDTAVDPLPAATRVYYLDDGVLNEYRSDTFAFVSSKTLSVSTSGLHITPDLVSTNAGIAALRNDGSLYLAGASIGPPATIPLPQLPDHISNLVAHHFTNLPLAAMVNDPFTGKILAAVQSDAAENANDVVEIDPATGKIGRKVLAGTDPSMLALSDDGTILYVVVDRANRVAIISLATFANTGSFGLGTENFSGLDTAFSIAVEPGAPNTVAVSRSGIRPTEVAIYDSGVQRSMVATLSGCNDAVTFANASTVVGADECDPSTFETISVDAQGAHFVKSASSLGSPPVVGTVGGNAFLPCRVVSVTTLDAVGSYPTCIAAIDAANNRAYAFNYPNGPVSEYELLTMRSVRDVSVAINATPLSRPILTSVGFAIPDAADHTWTLLVQSSFSVSVPWSAADAARIAQIAAYKGWTPAQVQKNGVALVAYLAALTHPTARKTWKAPPLGTATNISSTWQTSELPALKYVEFLYSVSDINAVRLGVDVLSYDLALTGH